MDENTTAVESSQDGTAVAETAENAAPSFTQEDIDSAVSAAVEAAQQQWKQEADEAAELAKLSKDEREKKQFELDKSKFETERAKFAREKLVLETQKQLSEKKLPSEFAELLTGADAVATLKNIDGFETAFSKAVEAAVNDRLKGGAPKTSGGSAAKTDPFLAGFGSI